MTFNFDQTIDRQTQHSFKWNRYQGRNIIPCWVADSDFRCAPAITQALTAMAEHGIYGYIHPDEYEEGVQAVTDWLQFRHGYAVPAEWVVWMPGVVPAFNTVCRAFTEAGQQLLVQSPNYPPILAAHKNHGLESITVNVVQEGARWVLDLEAIEQAAAKPSCQLMILCNPMNPCGSVVCHEQLLQLAQICSRHQLVLCSDEIHCDLILEPGVSHTPAYAVDGLRDNSVTLMSAAKTFNIAGLGVSFGIIPNPVLRRRYQKAASGLAPWANGPGLIATTAALRDSGDWYAQLIPYLRGNRDYLYRQINTIAGLKLESPEATFLAWVDASGLGVADVQAWFEGRGVGPSPGRDFAASQFARINFACPRSTLETIIARLTRV